MDLLKQFDQHLKALPPQLTCGKWTLRVYLRTFIEQSIGNSRTNWQ